MHPEYAHNWNASATAQQWDRLPLFCLLAGALLVSAACGKMRKEENWNSYYYGGYQEINGKFTYTGEGDNDSAYRRPESVSAPGANALSSSPADNTLLDVRPMMQPSDGRNK
ncbi:MAG: hypothetical protein FJX23_05080 [Alphaproteobacteria bacterium]|nr:hypothetical protein [Alphaproteobacteria bacterium]